VTIETPSQKLAGIQCLRGIAALMVVFYHVGIRMTGNDGEPSPYDVLMAGVDIFFVISGFIMWVTTAQQPDRTAGRFLLDRVQRIVPAYWVVTAALAVGLYLFAQPALASPNAGFDPRVRHTVLSFLFIPALNPYKGVYQPVLTAGWTLNLEMFFYVIFAAAMALFGRRLGMRALAILATLVGLAAWGFYAPRSGILGFYTQNLLLEFGAGLALGVCWTRGWAACSRFWWIPFVVGFAGLAYAVVPTGFPRAVEWGIPALLIVTGAVMAPVTWPAALQRLGDWSYSLYITHQVTLGIAYKGWEATGFLPEFLFPPVGTILSVGAAWLFFRTVEAPFTRYFKAKGRGTGSGGDHFRKEMAGSSAPPLGSCARAAAPRLDQI
jgi:exopolysaccharide production protein ExoZ